MMARLLLTALTLLLSVFLLACGGGGGSSGSSETPVTCSGTTLPATVAYANTSLARTIAVTITPTITGIPTGCDASKISYTATQLPAGMTIASSTGVISGTPTTLGATTPVVTLAVTGYSGVVTAPNFTLTVLPPPVLWSAKTSAHGIANLVTTHLLTVGTDVYLLGSQQSGNNYVPVLYKSSDAGVTWTNTGAAPSGFASLINFSATTDGTFLYLAGGRTSDATVTTASSYTYHDNVLKYTPGAGGAAGTWTTIATNAFSNATGAIGGAELAAMAYDAFTPGTMYYVSGDRKGLLFPALHKSTNYGVTWFMTSTTLQQMGHCVAIDSAGVLHSLGGYGRFGSSASSGDLASNFVSSNSGVTWTEKPAAALASPYQMSCAFIGSTLYAVGGMTKGGTVASGSVRRTTDAGATWVVDPASSTFASRAKAGLAVLASKLLVLGGSGNGTNTLADVIEGVPQ